MKPRSKKLISISVLFKCLLFFGIIKKMIGRIIIIDAIEYGAKFKPNIKSAVRVRYTTLLLFE